MISVKGLPFKHEDDKLVYFVGPRGTQVIVYANGIMDHPRLTSAERKELELRIRVDKVMVKIQKQFPTEDVNFLLSIPDRVGVNFLEVWGDYISSKKTPEQIVAALHELYRYHGLLWRG